MKRLVQSWRRLGVWALVLMAGLALVVGCGGGGGTSGGFSDSGLSPGVQQDGNTPLADLLPPDELGNRGGEGLLRGGDVGANTMERCTALDRYVVFHTTEALDPVRDTNAKHDVYLRDLLTGQVELVSLTPAGTAAGNNMSVYGVISQDGRYVAFASTATNLVVFTSLAETWWPGTPTPGRTSSCVTSPGNTTVRIAGGNSTATSRPSPATAATWPSPR